MRIKEWKYQDSGMSHGWYSKVRDLGEGEEMPETAEKVPDDEPLHNWQAEPRSF